MDAQLNLSPTRIEVNSLGNVLFRNGTELVMNATVKDKVHLDGFNIIIYKVDTGISLRLNTEALVQIVLADATEFTFDALVIHQSNTKARVSRSKVRSVYSRLLTSVFNGGCCTTSPGSGTCTPNEVFDDTDTEVFTLEEGDTAKAMSSSVTIAKVGTQVQFSSSAVEVIPCPNIIAHRVPSYTTGNTGDYPTLFAAGYFDILFPTGAIQMVQLGADNFTLASNNRFDNTSRYTATDGTPSDTGTARFSSYGSGVANIVIDHYRGVMWYNIELGSSATRWDNAQSEIDTINTASLGGFTDWIRGTRDLITISGMPDNNADSYTSPNMFISDTSTALRRYMTCELAAYSGLGFFVASNGGEASQSTTTTASGQNRVVACRLMTLSELFG